MPITIRNKSTGETKVIQESELPEYGISTPSASMNQSSSISSQEPERRPLGGQLPVIGSILGGTIPALTGFGLPFAAGGAAAGAAGGSMIENLIQDLMGTQKQTAPEQVGEVGTKAAVAGVSDLLTGGAGKLLGKIGGKVAPQLKGLVPKQISESISTVQKSLSKSIDDILGKSTVKIPTASIISELDSIKQTYARTGDTKALKAIEGVAEILAKQGDEMTLETANALKQRLGMDIFGQAGKEVTKRGSSGIAEKNAKKIVGGALEREIKANAPDVVPLFDQYGEAANLARQMNHPFQGWWKGSVAGMLLQPLGLSSLPLTAGVTAASMPYTRTLLQRLLGTAGPIIESPVTRGTVQFGTQELMNLMNQ